MRIFLIANRLMKHFWDNVRFRCEAPSLAHLIWGAQTKHPGCDCDRPH